MGKNNKLYMLLGTMCLIVYSAIVFLMPFARTSVFFVEYFFSIVSIILLFIVIYKYGVDKNKKNKFLGWAIIDLSIKFMLIQIILSIVIMVIPDVPLFISILLSVLLLFLFCIGLVTSDLGKEEIERIDDNVRNKTSIIHEYQIELEKLCFYVEDDSLKKDLKSLIDIIKYSDPVSDSSILDIENEISYNIRILSTLIKKGLDNDARLQCKELQRLVGIRNNRCLLLK
mgnify:CR=1 FL=1